MRRTNSIAGAAASEPDEQEYLAVLTDCALPGNVSRVFTDYLTIDHAASEAYVVVHKALFGRR